MGSFSPLPSQGRLSCWPLIEKAGRTVGMQPAPVILKTGGLELWRGGSQTLTPIRFPWGRGVAKTQPAVPTPEFLVQQVWSGALELAPLQSSQEMLMLLIWGPNFEKTAMEKLFSSPVSTTP